MSSHVFAVCAYGDHPRLADCLKSLATQSLSGKIVLATSTPSPYLEALAGAFNAEYRVNPEQNGGIAADWNFALSCCDADYCTIAHQDDIYLPEFAAAATRALDRAPDTLIAFCDYADLLGGTAAPHRLYLWVKRLLLWPFYLWPQWRSKAVKRWILRFGSPVCCPAVTYHLKNLGGHRFDAAYSVNLDWDMWLRLAQGPGSFVYCPRRLLLHRIDGAMETANAIADRRRADEDLRMFERQWPGWIARLIARGYSLSYRSNR